METHWATTPVVKIQVYIGHVPLRQSRVHLPLGSRISWRQLLIQLHALHRRLSPLIMYGGCCILRRGGGGGASAAVIFIVFRNFLYRLKFSNLMDTLLLCFFKVEILHGDVLSYKKIRYLGFLQAIR